MKVYLKTSVLTYVLFISVFFCSETGFAAVSGEAGPMIGLVNQTKVENVLIRATPLLKKFYMENGYQPAWRLESDSSQAKALLSVLKGASDVGLNPEVYHTKEIEALLTGVEGEGNLADSKVLPQLDLLLTDAFFLYASNIDFGLVNIYSVEPVWFHNSSEIDFVKILNDALDSNSVKETLIGLAPSNNAQYQAMLRALNYYKEIALRGGWPKIPEGKKGAKIKIGAQSGSIVALRRRLEVTGELDSRLADPNALIEELYDEELMNAVMRFQESHGLIPDGIVGDSTLAALNISVEGRICQLMINLDRVRFLSNEIKDGNYFLVNIPDFKVSVFEDGKVILKHKIIVGRKSRPTPFLADELTHVIFSPKWHVPETILLEDKIPALKKNPDFLRRNNMKMYEGFGKDAHQVDPSEVNLDEIRKGNIQYSIVQGPGAHNALGGVKFMFPNKHDVYLHDTPGKGLFNNSVRLFSSGCMRVENAPFIAQYLLKDKDGWDMEKIKKSMRLPSELYVYLDKKIPIYVIYLTAWVDENGTVQFRRDYYDIDNGLKGMFCSGV